MRTITHEQFLSELNGQCVPREHFAFKCPRCGTVQSAQSLINAGAGTDFEDVERYLGFSCVGRFTGAGSPRKKPDGDPCNWTLGGLLQMHELEINTPDGKTHPHFEVATKEEAEALMADQAKAESGK